MFKKQGQQYGQKRTSKAKNIREEAKEVEKLRSNARYAEALGLFSELKREALGSFEQRGKTVICF